MTKGFRRNAPDKFAYEAAMTSKTDDTTQGRGQELDYAYWRETMDGYWVTFRVADKNPDGTINAAAIRSTHGTAEEARTALAKAGAK